MSSTGRGASGTMLEQAFIADRQRDWEELAKILSVCSDGSVRRLQRQELRRFGELYRSACHDLAYARTSGASAELIEYLNALVGTAHGLLYATEARTWTGVTRFLAVEFPATFRKRLPFFWVAMACFLVGAILSFGMVAADPDNVDVFVPSGHPLRASLEAWIRGEVERDVARPERSIFASALFVNNTQVSLNAFAFGILGGILTAIILGYNGIVLGAFAAAVGHAGQQSVFWPSILPHGVVEISETFIAGAAGLSMGWALLAPGNRRRSAALADAARDAVKLVLGGALLLVYAGLTEAFLSHAPLPAGLKIAIGLGSGWALYVYLFRAGHQPPTGQAAASAPDSAPQRRR